MNYTDFTTALGQILNLTDMGGQALLNSMTARIIEAAELRIYREPQFDFLATRTSDVTALTTTGIRSVPVPSQFVVIEGASLITPANTLPTQSGAQRIPMMRVDRSFLDLTWPQETLTKAPTQIGDVYFSLFNEQENAPSDTSEPTSIPSSIQIAPTPDAEYHVEFTGTQRPPPLSNTNQTTFLSVFLPDLLLASAMIFSSGALLRNYGTQADNPQEALSWTNVYNSLRDGVAIEEIRKKSLAHGGSYRFVGSGEPANVAALQQMAARPNA